ncbi:MAG TPA: glycosyl hydrolase, partial [Puia sp.]|nr:glycosyl hydrolase [Puia sp.]
MRPLLLLLAISTRLYVCAQLQWPAVTEQTKPWTRWWWMGSAVDKADLAANMEKYAAAGLGGLELTPIYGVHGYEDRFISYLSPKWMDLLSYTLGEAKRLGLGMDMATGTGWPFGGGPLIDSTYACRELFHKEWTVKGGEALKDSVRFQQEGYVHTDGRPVTIDQLVEPVFANKDLQALALFQVRFPHSLPPFSLMAYSTDGRVLDLTGKVNAAGRLGWTAPAGADWTLYGLFLGWHGKMVERAAPGAEGNVIDHFSSKALRRYLSRMDTAFAGRDLTPLRCFFNDSYEVDDSRGQSNWTPAFFDDFRRLRGYDLREHLPALFGKDTPDNNVRVICDYRETISDLLLRQFTGPWREWARARGARIRDQAHGSPANILDLYAASDIPETEGGEILRYKFATSAAHVTGKPLASAETVTWLNEHFLSSYGDVKTALDRYFLGGVNHVFYHGTAYTPMNDPWPGWLFYASVHFTPNDPAWPYFSTLNRYVARCQSFLQKGTPDNDVLLYYPLYDSWSQPGNALLKHYDRMDPEFTGTGFKTCAEFLQARGYTFDYISDKQLQHVTAAPGGGISTGGVTYKTVLLPDCRLVSVAALQRLSELAARGVKVLVYRALPTGAPGWADQRAHAVRFHQSLASGRFVVGDDLDSLLDAAHVARETLVDDSLGFVRRKMGAGSVYFLENTGSKAFAGYLRLNTPFRTAAIFDPMTGDKGMARHRGDSVYMALRPGETCFVQTNPAARAA